MTAAEIGARVLRRIDDDPALPASVAPGPSVVPAEILAAINEGQELAAWLTLSLETTAPLTLPSATTFSNVRLTFPDYLVPLRLMGPSKRIRPATLLELDGLDEHWQSTPGVPERYIALGFNFWAVSPQPVDVVQTSLTYARSPQQMTADQFPELDEAYHGALVDYGIYRVRLKEGAQSLARGIACLNRFLDEMTALGDYVRARSRAASYDVLPFELRLFDRARLMQTVRPAA